jgi:putative salt-induced outer membrane protein YdiY
MSKLRNPCSAVKWIPILAALVIGGWGSRAAAQDTAMPDSIAEDVEGSTTESVGEATFSEAPDVSNLPDKDEGAPPRDTKALVDWVLSAGGAINTGNTSSWNLNAGTGVLLTKNEHRLTIDSLFNYGRANPDVTLPGSSIATVARQWFFNSRYEFYFTNMDAIWASLGLRWDPLAGFNLQLLANAGYLRAFIKEEGHLFTGRIGYSYTYENYTDAATALGTVLAKTSNIHGLLLALDYENNLNEHVGFLWGISYVGNLSKVPAQRDAKAFQDNRIYFTVALLSQIADKFAFEARFLLLYDSRPAGIYKTDTTTIFSLVYTPFKADRE